MCAFTCVMFDRPIKYDTKHTTAIKISRLPRSKRGNSSTRAVMNPSTVQNYTEYNAFISKDINYN